MIIFFLQFGTRHFDCSCFNTTIGRQQIPKIVTVFSVFFLLNRTCRILLNSVFAMFYYNRMYIVVDYSLLFVSVNIFKTLQKKNVNNGEIGSLCDWLSKQKALQLFWKFIFYLNRNRII